MFACGMTLPEPRLCVMTGSGPVGWKDWNRKKMARKMVQQLVYLEWREEEDREEREGGRHKEGGRGKLLGEQEAAGMVWYGIACQWSCNGMVGFEMVTV